MRDAAEPTRGTFWGAHSGTPASCCAPQIRCERWSRLAVERREVVVDTRLLVGVLYQWRNPF